MAPNQLYVAKPKSYLRQLVERRRIEWTSIECGSIDRRSTP